MDYFNDVFSIARDLGVFGFIVWGVQKIINNSSERKFATYKSQIDLQLLGYKSQYDKQIEQHKSELKFLNDRLAALHTERFEIIKELNNKLVNLNSAMVRLVSPRWVHPDKEKAKENEESIIQDVQKAYSDYNNFILFNQIYFDKQFANKLLKIRDQYFDAQWDFFEPQRLENMGMTRGDAYRESGKKVIDASRRIREQIPQLIIEVEDDFRKLLGVEG